MVIFRSMEGQQRAKVAFESDIQYKNFFKKFCNPIYDKCINEEKRMKLKFNDKYMIVEEAVEPELLNWKNYAIKTPEKILRWIIYAVYTILTLYACFQGIF